MACYLEIILCRYLIITVDTPNITGPITTWFTERFKAHSEHHVINSGMDIYARFNVHAKAACSIQSGVPGVNGVGLLGITDI
ncbi:hypothetical protein O9929_25440 [Vibrio lentus]|nr:hypothetical protein [Vibrio lentus]